MQARQRVDSKARSLRRATMAEICFLVSSAFFLFTKHRAHYLGTLPYELAIIAVTVFLWFLAERRNPRLVLCALSNAPRDKDAEITIRLEDGHFRSLWRQRCLVTIHGRVGVVRKTGQEVW